MKKIIVLFLLLVAPKLWAQDCPNGDFENWTRYSWSAPDSGWLNSNAQSLYQADSLTVWSVTGVSGHAVHIQTAIVGTDTLQAYITMGDPSTAIGGVPYSQQPTAITGYYRYNLVGNDTALLLVIFKKSGAVISTGWFKIRGTGSESAFTAFSYPISLSAVPDTVLLAAASSNLQGAGLQSGSWLELDELAFTGTGITQAIPDGNFDTWAPDSVFMPVGWQSSPQFGLQGSGITRSAQHISGNYSLELTSLINGGHSSQPVSATQVTNGQMSPHNGPVGGQPYTLTTDTLIGYYKYAPVGLDTANVFVNLIHSGTFVGGSGAQLNAASVWTAFMIPFNAFTAPDTIQINIASGSWTATVPGSALNVDYLQLKSQPLPPLGVAQMPLTELPIILFPNPVRDNYTITLPYYRTGTAVVTVCDLSGRLAATYTMDLGGHDIHLDATMLSPGMYFVTMKNEGLEFHGKLVKD